MELTKIQPKKMISGVLAGIAYQTKMKTWLIRLIFLSIAVLTSIAPMIFLYILFAIFLPSTNTVPKDYHEICE